MATRLLSIAGVILGGGEFVGGRVSPIGAVIGALTLALAASPLLTFMHIPPDWQVAANGAILIIVLAARVLDQPQGSGAMMSAVDRLLAKPWIWSFVGAVAGLARGDRLHRRLWRGRHAHRGAVARGVHGDRRRRADVRHHARARQCRSVAAGQYRARQRRRDEGDGRQ